MKVADQFRYTCMLAINGPGCPDVISSAIQWSNIFQRRSRHSNSSCEIRSVDETTDKHWHIVVEQVPTLFHVFFCSSLMRSGKVNVFGGLLPCQVQAYSSCLLNLRKVASACVQLLRSLENTPGMSAAECFCAVNYKDKEAKTVFLLTALLQALVNFLDWSVKWNKNEWCPTVILYLFESSYWLSTFMIRI